MLVLMLTYVHIKCLRVCMLKYEEAVTQTCSVKKGVLRNFVKFTGKHLCQRLFLNKVASLRPFYRTPPDDCFCQCTWVWKAALKTKGGSGLSWMDVDGWKTILTSKQFAESSTDLCTTIGNS